MAVGNANRKLFDERFMRMAVEEARHGIGQTAPNPAVGAVLVKKGRVIGTGWHQRAGAPHAEIEALRSLANPKDARGATIYVTLEPCSTHGKTPPCTEGIVSAGIREVIYGARDPNPCHAGRADKILESAGVKVTSGVLAEECAKLNEAWNHWIVTGLPFVIAKAGMSLDGRIGSPPGRRWITSTASRKDAMALRATCDAILVGGETVRVDNPKLTLRGIPHVRQPVRAIWTKSGNLPPDSHIFTDRHKDKTRVFKNLSLRACLRALGKSGIQSVLIEGGGRTLGEAFDRGLVNRAVFYVAPVILGGPVPAVGGRGAASPEAGYELAGVTYSQIGPDIRIEGEVIRSKPRS